MFIGLLSFLAIFVFLIMSVIAFFKKNGKVKRWLFTALGCFVLLIVAIVADSSKPSTTTTTSTSTEVSKAEKQKSDEQAKKIEASQKKLQAEVDAKKKADETSAPQTPQQKLENAVTSAIGEKSDRGDKKKLTTLTIDAAGNIIVKFKIDDNFSKNLIALGTEDDIIKSLKAIKNSGIDFKNITIYATFPMQDKYGNSGEETVVNVEYSKETVNKINFDNFIRKNIYSIADTKVLVHPDFISN